LLAAASRGETAWVGPSDDRFDTTNDPTHADAWQDRIVGAHLIRWLCVDPAAGPYLSLSGLRLGGARIEGRIDLSCAVVRFPLAFISCGIRHGLHLGQMQAQGLNLECSHTGPISAREAVVDGSLVLRFVRVTGEVDALGADVRGYLTCSGAQLLNPDGTALGANSARFARGVFLNSWGGRGAFRAYGKVDLVAVRIGGSLDCAGGHFLNGRGVALRAPRSRDGSHSAMASGLTDRSIFREPRSAAISIARPAGFSIEPGTRPSPPSPSAPGAPGSAVDGFVYDAISRSAFKGPERIAWLAKQGTEYRPQPYKQLARALFDAGQPADAKAVEIAKEQARRESLAAAHGRLTGRMLRVWSFILKKTIGYGYRPWNLAVPALVTLSLGWVLCSTGYEARLFVPTQEHAAADFRMNKCEPPDGYPQFNSFIYSLESLLPGANLKLRDYWTPDSSGLCRREVGHVLGYDLPPAVARAYTELLEQTLRGYLWIHVMVGWILAALLGAALTGVVHRE